MDIDDGRADRFGRDIGIGAAGARRAFGDDDDAVVGGECRDVAPTHDRRGGRRRGLDVLRVVMQAVDEHHVGTPACDVQLAVEIDPEIPGAQPRRIDR